MLRPWLVTLPFSGINFSVIASNLSSRGTKLEMPGHSRVIGFVRLDLESRQSFVRYLNHDVGSAYRVATDDPTVFPEDIADARREAILSASAETLARYEPLFASLSSLMYLPVFFIDAHDRVAETRFSTELHAKRASTAVRRAVRHLGREQLYFSRRAFCLQGDQPQSSDKEEMTVVPPELEHADSGFWKSLPPGAVGEDEEGNAIVGKTWVERTDTWFTHGVEEFVVRRHGIEVEGANPGYVYVMRSGSHGLDVYKIGKRISNARNEAATAWSRRSRFSPTGRLNSSRPSIAASSNASAIRCRTDSSSGDSKTLKLICLPTARLASRSWTRLLSTA